MGKPCYLVTDLGAQAATVITVSSESAGHPRGRLHDAILASPFVSASKTTLTIDWDFGAAVAFDFLSLHGHNFTSAMTAELRAGSSSPPTAVVATFVHRTDSMYVRFTAANAQYLRLVVSDANTENLRIGEAPVGTSILFPRAARFGGLKGRVRRDIYEETDGGVVYVRPQVSRDALDVPFRIMRDDETAFDTLDLAVNGRAIPFTFVPDVNLAPVYYVRKERDYRAQELEQPAVESGNQQEAYDYVLSLLGEVPVATVAD